MEVLFALQLHCKKKLSQLPAVDMQHAPAKLPSKLHLSVYVDLLAQMLHSDCVSALEILQSIQKPAYL